MPFCYRCGRELTSDAKFCDACGVSVAGSFLPRLRTSTKLDFKTARNVVIAIALTLFLYFLITVVPFYMK